MMMIVMMLYVGDVVKLVMKGARHGEVILKVDDEDYREDDEGIRRVEVEEKRCEKMM